MRTKHLALAAGLALAGAVRAQPLLHYSFDDESDPTSNLGTLGDAYDGAIGAGIEFVPFAGGAAIGLDSVEDGQVTVLGNDNAFDIADGDFSVAATVVTTNLEPGEPGGRFVVTKEKIGQNDGWALAVVRDSGIARFAIATFGVGSLPVESRTTVNDGEPHEIVGCRTGDYLVIAVDGVVEAVTKVPDGFGSTAQNPHPVVIGGRSIGEGSPTTGPNDEFLGTIDEVMIHDVALLDVPCPADCNADGVLDILDFVCFQVAWQDQTDFGDCDANGVHDMLDFACYQAAFQTGCP